MPKGTSRSEGSSGENISHFHAIRMRVVGAGSLQMTLYSIDDIQNQSLVPFSLSATTHIQPTRLSNFIQQRASLEIKTTEVNEYFRINRIIVFCREYATSYPG
jgi:hypothetical protein